MCMSEHVQNVIRTFRIYRLFEWETFSSAIATEVFLCSRLYSNSHLAHNSNRTVLGILRIHQIIITSRAAGEGRQKVSLPHFFAGLNQHSQWPLQRWHMSAAQSGTANRYSKDGSAQRSCSHPCGNWDGTRHLLTSAQPISKFDLAEFYSWAELRLNCTRKV